MSAMPPATAVLATAPRDLDPVPGGFGGDLLLWALPPTYRRFRLGAAVTYHTTRVGTICVPKDTVTDFASIPRPLWWLLPPPAATPRRPSSTTTCTSAGRDAREIRSVLGHHIVPTRVVW